MKYKLCSIRIKVTKYEVISATKGEGEVNPKPSLVVMTVPYSNSRLSKLCNHASEAFISSGWVQNIACKLL